MTKIFLDSNIWVRPLVENSNQSQQALTLIKAIDSGLFKPYTSTVVLLEVTFVLSSFYKVKLPLITKHLSTILKTKNLTLIETTNLNQAIKLHQQTKVKLTDCLIALQVPKSAHFVSFDQEFKKIPDISLKTPSQLLLGSDSSKN